MNTIYVEDLIGNELSITQINLENNSVVAVQDVDGTEYGAQDINILTPSDYIYIKDIGRRLCVGMKVCLSRLDLRPWVLKNGEYSVDGNPSIFGWYLESIPAGQIRSLQGRDLFEIEVITN